MNSRKHKKILAILVIFTLSFIWGNSLMPASVSGAISEWVKDMINSIFGGVSGGGGLSGDGILRKIAHASEFAMLGVGLTVFLRILQNKTISLLFLSGLSVALIDETIQLFVDGRAGLIKDIWIDLGGFIVGCVVVWTVLQLLFQRKPKQD